MRRSPRLLRVVAHDRPFLLAVPPLHRHIQIQNPGRGQHRLGRLRQGPLEPGHARRFVHPCERPSRRILRDESCNAQQLRVDAIMANRRNMRVAVVSGEDRPQQGRQHRALIRRVVAVVGQRAICDPGLEQATHFEKLDEERQLSKRGHRCSRVPLHVDPATECIECNRLPCPDQGLA
jgi:hypothetical protein